MSDLERWSIITENESCRNRVKMIEEWKYPYCCSICGSNKIRHTPCNYDRCPLSLKGKTLVDTDDLDALFKQIEKDNKYSIIGDTPEWIKIRDKYYRE